MNQQYDCEEDIQTQPLVDLPLSGEEAEKAKAGAGKGTGSGAGKSTLDDIKFTPLNAGN
jgi:hypothetical protein